MIASAKPPPLSLNTFQPSPFSAPSLPYPLSRVSVHIFALCWQLGTIYVPQSCLGIHKSAQIEPRPGLSTALDLASDRMLSSPNSRLTNRRSRDLAGLPTCTDLRDFQHNCVCFTQRGYYADKYDEGKASPVSTPPQPCSRTSLLHLSSNCSTNRRTPSHFFTTLLIKIHNGLPL